MISRIFAVYVAVILIPFITGIAVNARVYRYFYLTPAEVEYGLLVEDVCAGFVILAAGNNGVQVQPGRVVCVTGRGENVYESASIRVRASFGALMYSRLLRLYVNTTRPLTLHVVVEYPARALNATLALYKGRNMVGVLQLSNPGSRLTLYVEPGVTEYNLNLHVACYKQGTYNFRVGVYIASR